MDFTACRFFHARFGGQVRERLKRGDKLRPAIGIAAVVQGVDTDEDVSGF